MAETLPTPVVAATRSLTRTETIMAVVRQQLIARATLLDGALDLAKLQISIQLDPGTNVVRGVQIVEERFYLNRRRS